MDRYSQLVRRRIQQIRTSSRDNDDQDDFATGFVNFRTSHDNRPGLTAAAAAYRRRTNPLFSFKICCLDGPTQRITPILIRRLNSRNLGTKKLLVGRNEGFVAFRRKIRELFPALGETDFTFKAATTASRNMLTVLECHTIRELKHVVRAKSLFVCPDQILRLNEDITADLPQSDNHEELYDPGLNNNNEAPWCDHSGMLTAV